jgi:hypothetical protein
MLICTISLIPEKANIYNNLPALGLCEKKIANNVRNISFNNQEKTFLRIFQIEAFQLLNCQLEN